MAACSIETFFTCKHSQELTKSAGLYDTDTGTIHEYQRSFTAVAEDQILNEGTVLPCSTTSFIVKGCKGKGIYGQVNHGVDMTTNTPVAIKMFTSTETCFEDAEREYFILEMLSKLNPDRYNLIRLYETLVYDNKPCLVFELLDRSLSDLVDGGSLLSLAEIRPIAQQLLVALAGIKSLGIVHSDLKPDNVMLVNHRDQPFKVKLIDFGVARPTKTIKPGSSLQPNSFRAPEVILGLPVSEAIDMWSLGCVLVFLFLGIGPFPGSNEYEVMRYIIDTVGMPDVSLLYRGIKTEDFFHEDATKHGWNFKSPEEYEAETGVKVSGPESECLSSLDDIKIMRYVIDNPHEFDKSAQDPDQVRDTEVFPSHDIILYEDGEAFISLLQQIFMVDPQRRITPEEALRHPFITMEHLSCFSDSSPHIEKSLQAMQVCEPLEDVKNIPDPDLSQDDRQDDNIPSGASLIKNKIFAVGTKIIRVKTFCSSVIKKHFRWGGLRRPCSLLIKR